MLGYCNRLHAGEPSICRANHPYAELSTPRSWWSSMTRRTYSWGRSHQRHTSHSWKKIVRIGKTAYQVRCRGNRPYAELATLGVEVDEVVCRPRPPKKVRDANRRPIIIAAKSAEIEFFGVHGVPLLFLQTEASAGQIERQCFSPLRRAPQVLGE